MLDFFKAKKVICVGPFYLPLVEIPAKNLVFFIEKRSISMNIIGFA
jgi:hypothetical protein